MRKFQYLLLGFVAIAFVVVGFLVFTPKSVQTNKIEPYLRIESGNNTKINTRFVNLYLLGPKNVDKMMVSNHPNFDGAEWEGYKTKKKWVLDYGRGSKRVYAKFKTKDGEVTQVFRDSILLQIPASMDADFEIEDGSEDIGSRYVTLDLDYSNGVEQVKISNSKDFSHTDWRRISDSFFWSLSSGQGEKTVYIKFKDGNNKTKVVKDTIELTPTPNQLQSGSVLATVDRGVYYYGFDGFLHRFANAGLFHSWYQNFEDVEMVSKKKLSSFVIDDPVCIKAGTWLVKFSGQSQVYAVEPGCKLRPIHSPVEAFVIYGSDWNKRIMELPSGLKNSYEVEKPWYDDDIEDRDRDGVPASVEDDYQSKENSKDTDSDNLSDYEEIYFWFTDPADSDSDGDGIKDGAEILSGRSPLGPGKIKRLPDDTYNMPVGSVVEDSDGSFYYKKQNNEYEYLSDSIKDSEFISNGFQDRFTIDPVFEMKLEPKSEDSVDNKQDLLRLPTVRGASDNLMKL